MSYPHHGFRNGYQSYRHCYDPIRYRHHWYGHHHGNHYGLYAYYGYPGFTYYDDYYWPYPRTHTTVYVSEPAVEVYENQVVVQDSALPQEDVQTAPVMPTPSVDPQTIRPQGTSGTDQPPGNLWIDNGSAAFASGRYEEARSLFLQAAFANESDGFAKLLYGLASFARGEYRLSAVAVRRALTIDPELIVNPVDLRGFYPDADTLEAHLKTLSDSLVDNPLDADGFFLLGYLYYAIAKPQTAYDTLQKALEVDPTDELAIRVSERAKHFADAENAQ